MHPTTVDGERMGSFEPGKPNPKVTEGSVNDDVSIRRELQYVVKPSRASLLAAQVYMNRGR